MIEKIKKGVFAVSASALVLPVAAFAQWDPNRGPSEGGISNWRFIDVLTTLMKALLGLIAVVAVIMFVVAGIYYLTAIGNQERIKTATNILTYAIVGIIVALLGWIIVTALSAWLVEDNPAI